MRSHLHDSVAVDWDPEPGTSGREPRACSWEGMVDWSGEAKYELIDTTHTAGALLEVKNIS